MTVTEQFDSWRAVFEARDIDLEETDAPAHLEGHGDAEWFQAITRFTKRGFLRVTVSPVDESLVIYAQLVIPGAQDDYAGALKRYLNDLAGADWSVEAEEHPWALEVKALPQEKLDAIVDAFEHVAEHISRAEEGAQPAELAREFGSKTPQAEEPAPQADQPQQADEASAPASSGSPFESIGNGNGSAGPTGAAALAKFRVRVVDKTVRIELDLVDPVDESTEKQLLAALSRTLTARFDIKLRGRELVERDGRPTVELVAEPATLGAASAGETGLGELGNGLGRYLERLKKFNDMGMSLMDVLAPNSTGATSRRRAEQPSRSRAYPRDDQSRDEAPEPKVRPREDRRRAESDASGVVFSFGGADLDTPTAATDGLEPGNYTDPRIRREDATTPLVDVVLRHPGYSDKSMRQVLSILLDIDYYEATKLRDQAPCVIAWGISQERAQEFKRVIERAGGRVTLVEPDSLQQ